MNTGMCLPVARWTSAPRTGAQALRARRSEQEVSHQTLARRDLLIGKDVPWAQLEAARFHQGPDIRLAVRAGPQVILGEDRLPVEQKAPVGRVRLEPRDQIIDNADEAGLERGARQVPLAVPVGMRDQMKDQAGHGAPKPKGATMEVREPSAPPSHDSAYGRRSP